MWWWSPFWVYWLADCILTVHYNLGSSHNDQNSEWNWDSLLKKTTFLWTRCFCNFEVYVYECVCHSAKYDVLCENGFPFSITSSHGWMWKTPVSNQHFTADDSRYKTRILAVHGMTHPQMADLFIFTTL